ncbi:NAD(P)/FAD-dependent oxidoreductase [Asticcacaulis sp. EMRT-3]|uniref:NAD(P)/FAD-dependent oxidoreductase n=1 Tax=Asticcacaulis sp. EMRT-3 TaxID=3040349 RepID=UPI0024AF8A88|nr:NAD(P)/FAD-dependent oxidoreductase [Asticcacaulis sp. EMRT-3]MDI7774668.1 NAD(P)/FAD-dependent oxidoreductase [Asticcacaulis sp. EMRT-3]
MKTKHDFDVVVLGAGAAGLMCAIEAARRGRRVLVIDHAAKPAEKIRISGGGKCNFTHLHTAPKNFLSDNPRFCISALRRFTPHDFLDRVVRRGIPYYEKTEGQLFCENSAHDIITMLLDDLHDGGGQLRLNTSVSEVAHHDGGFTLTTTRGKIACAKLVMATGGLSIPKIGATGFAYEIARQFGHTIIETRAGLVPFALGDDKLDKLAGLSGVSLTATASLGKTRFTDGFLFTHRGLSGPAVLQLSSYWRTGQPVSIDLMPGTNAAEWLRARKAERPKASLATIAAEALPKRLAERWLEMFALPTDARMADLPNKTLDVFAAALNAWTFTPMGTEGYRTAEVTVGGVDTRALSSQTLESQIVPGLHFIGECVDVTGWLGGYNFQWAWASGWAAGQAV